VQANKDRNAALRLADEEEDVPAKPVPPAPSVSTEPVPVKLAPPEPLPTESVPIKNILDKVNEGLNKKAELDAAKADGIGNITNIAQNNSSNVNQQRTTIQNKSMIDPETSQVVASGQT